eukprot:7382245-Prymnesium_polylepis.1
MGKAPPCALGTLMRWRPHTRERCDRWALLTHTPQNGNPHQACQRAVQETGGLDDACYWCSRSGPRARIGGSRP